MMSNDTTKMSLLEMINACRICTTDPAVAATVEQLALKHPSSATPSPTKMHSNAASFGGGEENTSAAAAANTSYFSADGSTLASPYGVPSVANTAFSACSFSPADADGAFSPSHNSSIVLPGRACLDAFPTPNAGDAKPTRQQQIVKQQLCQELVSNFGGHVSTTIERYCDRIERYARSDEYNCVIVMLLKRLQRKVRTVTHGEITQLPSSTIHRLVFAATVVAVKLTCDIHETLCFYAPIGGINLTDAGTLELSFMRLLNFDLYATEEDCLMAGEGVSIDEEAAWKDINMPKLEAERERLSCIEEEKRSRILSDLRKRREEEKEAAKKDSEQPSVAVVEEVKKDSHEDLSSEPSTIVMGGSTVATRRSSSMNQLDEPTEATNLNDDQQFPRAPPGDDDDHEERNTRRPFFDHNDAATSIHQRPYLSPTLMEEAAAANNDAQSNHHPHGHFYAPFRQGGGGVQLSAASMLLPGHSAAVCMLSPASTPVGTPHTDGSEAGSRVVSSFSSAERDQQYTKEFMGDADDNDVVTSIRVNHPYGVVHWGNQSFTDDHDDVPRPIVHQPTLSSSGAAEALSDDVPAPASAFGAAPAASSPTGAIRGFGGALSPLPSGATTPPIAADVRQQLVYAPTEHDDCHDMDHAEYKAHHEAASALPVSVSAHSLASTSAAAVNTSIASSGGDGSGPFNPPTIATLHDGEGSDGSRRISPEFPAQPSPAHSTNTATPTMPPPKVSTLSEVDLASTAVISTPTKASMPSIPSKKAVFRPEIDDGEDAEDCSHRRSFYAPGLENLHKQSNKTPPPAGEDEAVSLMNGDDDHGVPTPFNCHSPQGTSGSCTPMYKGGLIMMAGGASNQCAFSPTQPDGSVAYPTPFQMQQLSSQSSQSHIKSLPLTFEPSPHDFHDH